MDTKPSHLETNFILSFPAKRLCRLKAWFAVAAWAFIWFCAAHPAWASLSKQFQPFGPLQERLVDEGFDKSFIHALYARPEAVFDHKGITAYFSHRESTLNYDQFLSKKSLGKATAYLKTHSNTLNQVRQRYGVDGEVVTAILLVESRLGAYIGTHPVLNTLSNMAALKDPSTRDMVWDRFVKEKASQPKDSFDKWAARKSEWAFGELKAYLKYVNEQNLDAFSMKGSYAGALGFAQFVPSSVLKFGKDGNQDGHVNLYQHGDAIESVANYLKQHGWHPGLNRDKAFRVLLRYNNSKYYANTILDVADRLKKVK